MSLSNPSAPSPFVTAGLLPFDLPSIFRCTVELGSLLKPSADEFWTSDAEIAGARLLHVLNPRKAKFPLNHEWDMFERYREEGVPWPNGPEPRPGWAQEIDLADASLSARRALLTIGLALADLRGGPEFQQRGFDLLRDGTWNLWDGMQSEEREKVQHLLPETYRVWNWPQDPQSLPETFSGLTASLSDPRILGGDWRTGNLSHLNHLQHSVAASNFRVCNVNLANDGQFPVFRWDCKPSMQGLPSICPKADPKPPVEILPEGDLLATIEERFSSLGLIKDQQTIHWIGRQHSPETTCTCDLSLPSDIVESEQWQNLLALRRSIIRLVCLARAEFGGRLDQKALESIDALGRDVARLCQITQITLPVFSPPPSENLKLVGSASLPIMSDQPRPIIPYEVGQNWASEWRAVRVAVDCRITQMLDPHFHWGVDTRETPLEAPVGLPEPLAVAYETTVEALVRAVRMQRFTPTRWSRFSKDAIELSNAWNLAREKYVEAELWLQGATEEGRCAHRESLAAICNVNDACGHVMLKCVPFHRAVAHVQDSPKIDLVHLVTSMRQQVSRAALRFGRQEEEARMQRPISKAESAKLLNGEQFSVEESEHEDGSSDSNESSENFPSVVLHGLNEPPVVQGTSKNPLTRAQYDVVKALLDAGERGLSKDELDRKSGHGDSRKILKRLAESDADWRAVISFPGSPGRGYRII